MISGSPWTPKPAPSETGWSFPDQGERARVAVGKAIRRALARITETDPILGEHLRQTVHTGVRCSYWPG